MKRLRHAVYRIYFNYKIPQHKEEIDGKRKIEANFKLKKLRNNKCLLPIHAKRYKIMMENAAKGKSYRFSLSPTMIMVLIVVKGGRVISHDT